MPSLAASPFLDALGWALLNSIWQFGVLWCLYYVLTAGIKLSASARHSLAVYMLLAGAGWFIVSLSWKYYSHPAPLSYTLALENNAWYAAYENTRSWMDRLMPWWSAAYLVCIVLLFIKFCLFVRQANLLQQKDISRLPVEWRLYVKNIAALLGIEKGIKAVVSARVDTPQVIGFLKPVILVPLACINHLSTEQLEAVLLHELVHIRRNDYLVNLFVATAEILFFFNPFVKQLVAAVRKEREYSCDDMVLQFRYQPQQYASALLSLERSRTSAVTFGIAASGRGQKQLLVRVQRIIGIKSGYNKLPQAGAYLAVVMLLGFIAMVNPVKIVADKINPALARINIKNNFTINPSNNDNNITIVNVRSGAPKPVRKEGHKKGNAPYRDTDDSGDEMVVDLQPASSSNGSGIAEAGLEATVSLEQRDFSLPEGSTPAAPPPPYSDISVASTYVPNNSFSYHLVPDTNLPKVKGETYTEKQAREALTRTKIAMNQINWQRIERELRYNKRSLNRLKAEISKELSALNWQQINQDVQEQQKTNELQKARAIVLKEQAIKEYQQNEAYSEALREQLMQRDQLIKANEQQLQNQQKELINEQRKKSAEQTAKKKRIVYI